MVRIVLFDGEDSGWKMWSLIFISLTRMKDWDDILDGTVTFPDIKLEVDEIEELANYNKLFVMNKKAYGLLRASLGCNVFMGIVENSRKKNCRKGTLEKRGKSWKNVTSPMMVQPWLN